MGQSGVWGVHCLSCYPTRDARLCSAPTAPAGGTETGGYLWQILVPQFILHKRAPGPGRATASSRLPGGSKAPSPPVSSWLGLQRPEPSNSQYNTALGTPQGGLEPRLWLCVERQVVRYRSWGRPEGPGGPHQSVHELSVALCPGDNDIHPDAHGLCRGGHHVIQPVVGLHTEGEGRVRALWRKGESEMGPPSPMPERVS